MAQATISLKVWAKILEQYNGNEDVGSAFFSGMAMAIEHPEWAQAVVADSEILTNNGEYNAETLKAEMIKIVHEFPITSLGWRTEAGA